MKPGLSIIFNKLKNMLWSTSVVLFIILLLGSTGINTIHAWSMWKGNLSLANQKLAEAGQIIQKNNTTIGNMLNDLRSLNNKSVSKILDKYTSNKISENKNEK